MRKLVGALFACLVLIGLSGAALSGPMTLYSIDSKKAVIYAIDSTNGSTISSAPITMAGHTVFHGNGMAVNPLTNELYVILEIGFQDRELAKLNPVTGVATLVGPTGNIGWSGITFAADGTLYALTGDGTVNGISESLYTMDASTGTPTFLVTLGNGSSGEALSYNPDDNLIYHASGSSTQVFETVARSMPFVVTNIPQSGDTHSEVTALLYAGGGLFYFGDNHEETDRTLTPRFYSITDDGEVDFLGQISHISKGLAFFAPTDSTQAPEPGGLALLGLGLAAGALARRKKRR